VVDATETEPGAERVEQPPGGLWQRIRAEPERAPEHIALAAADRFAGPAERWAAAMLAHHEPRKAAKVAYKKHVRLARVEGAVTGVGGFTTTAIDLVGLAWIQSRMVFYVAAAMGYDPRHPMRPAELLALQQVYPTPAEARAALDGVGTHLAIQLVTSRQKEGVLLGQLVRYAGRWAAKKTVLKVIPFVASPISAVQNGRATADLGQRTLRFYGAG
jgi:hypothetical protein